MIERITTQFLYLLVFLMGATWFASSAAASPDEFLEPNKAFQFSAQTTEDGFIVARWVIAPGYYLYRDRFKFKTNGTGFVLGDPELPAGEMKNDEFFGRMEVYHHGVEARIPVHANGGASKTLTFSASYQGCAQAGMCYPPMTKTVALDLSGVHPGASASAKPGSSAGAAADEPISEQDSIAQSLASGNILVTLLAFFGFGLLLSFTPCVFPMIPILSSIIIGQGENITSRKAFVLSLVYVLSVSLTYTLTGVAAGLLGENIQAVFQNPWAIGSFAAVFVALSFSMFGFYDLQLPASLQGKLAEISNSQQGGNLIGVAIMGLLSALIVGPCVAAPLAGALIYIGQSGDAVLGGLALFTLSLGMGLPLLVIGASAGKLLPKAGTWMESIKAVFGVVLLGFAIWMLDRIVPPQITLALSAVLLIVSAVYLGALDGLLPEASGWRKLWKGLGVVMLVNGALLFIGLGLSSGYGGFQAPQNLGVGSVGSDAAHQSEKMAFIDVKGIADVDRRLEEAKVSGRDVVLDFYADWCVSCKEMERFTFSNAKVQAALSNAVLLRADVTDWDDTDKQLSKRHKVLGPPAILFFDGKSMQEKGGYRVVGYMGPDKFREHVEKALE